MKHLPFIHICRLQRIIIIATVLLAFSANISYGKALKTTSGRINVSGGGYIYYEETGKGEPVLLLHGHSLDRRMWASQVKAFAKHFRVICPDFRGYGKSSDQDEALQMTHLDDIITLMDSLHIERAHIVGLSMGSFVGGDCVAMHPERLISCVLASGAIRSTKGPSEPMDSLEAAKRDKEIAELKQKGIQKMKEEWIEALTSGGGSHAESIRKPLTEMINDWTAWQPLHKEVRLFYARDAWERLKQVRPSTPVLMITGEKEAGKSPRRPAMLTYLPNGQWLILPDCGHMLNMERPKLFNKTVLKFLKKHREK